MLGKPSLKKHFFHLQWFNVFSVGFPIPSQLKEDKMNRIRGSPYREALVNRCLSALNLWLLETHPKCYHSPDIHSYSFVMEELILKKEGNDCMGETANYFFEESHPIFFPPSHVKKSPSLLTTLLDQLFLPIQQTKDMELIKFE